MLAANNGFCRVVDNLIEKGANLNEVSHNNRDALMFAISEGHVEIALKLIEADAGGESRFRAPCAG